MMKKIEYKQIFQPRGGGREIRANFPVVEILFNCNVCDNILVG